MVVHESVVAADWTAAPADAHSEHHHQHHHSSNGYGCGAPSSSHSDHSSSGSAWALQLEGTGRMVTGGEVQSLLRSMEQNSGGQAEASGGHTSAGQSTGGDGDHQEDDQEGEAEDGGIGQQQAGAPGTCCVAGCADWAQAGDIDGLTDSDGVLWAQHVWCATGSTVNCQQEAVLKGLLQEAPLPVHGGMPLVAEDLRCGCDVQACLWLAPSC